MSTLTNVYLPRVASSESNFTPLHAIKFHGVLKVRARSPRTDTWIKLTFHVFTSSYGCHGGVTVKSCLKIFSILKLEDGLFSALLWLHQLLACLMLSNLVRPFPPRWSCFSVKVVYVRAYLRDLCVFQANSVRAKLHCLCHNDCTHTFQIL